MDVLRSRVGAGRATARCGLPPCCRGSFRSWPWVGRQVAVINYRLPRGRKALKSPHDEATC